MDRPDQITGRHLEKLAIVYPRQSSPGQVRDNVGSAEVQRRLADRARAWGWPESRILTIEDDWGVTASRPGQRAGFKKMLKLIRDGEVALVLTHDMARAGRNMLEGPEFVQAIFENGVLLDVNGQLYDGASQSLAQQLGLHLQTMMAWWDQATRTRTFREAKRAKIVHKRLAVSPPPGGFVTSVRGKWALHPQPEVREAFRRLFQLYLELGSALKVARYHWQHNLLFPRCRPAEIRWDRVKPLRIARILRNPNYSPDYVYFRTRWPARGTEGVRHLPRSEWLEIKDHHEGYVSREDWERIQMMLDRNRPGSGTQILGGAALLAGLLWCGRCDRRAAARYDRRIAGKRLPAYLCRTVNTETNELVDCCFWIPSERIDDALVDHLLTALSAPSAADIVAAVDRYGDECRDTFRARAGQLRLAEEAVKDARRRYVAVDPSNDLVRADLEATLEQAIRERDELKRQVHGRLESRVERFDPSEVQRLCDRITAIWHAETTTNEDRKRLLRLAISRVTVHSITEDAIDIQILWGGGLAESDRIVRSKGLTALIAELRERGMTNGTIAETLRAKGVKSRAGGHITRQVVVHRVRRLGIQHKVSWHAAAARIRELYVAGASPREILIELQANGPRHYRDRWTYKAVLDCLRKLRVRSVYGVSPLPLDALPQPVARTEAATVSLMCDLRTQGWSWKAVADELNARGLRPARREVFTDRRCATVFYAWRSRTSGPDARGL